MSQPLKVACAVIIQDGKILVTLRGKNMSQPLKWEFPGGKVELGESSQEALVREIIEELGIEIEVGQALSPVIYHYPNISIELLPFVAQIITGKIVLDEHMEYKWALPDELPDFDWAPADIPLMEEVVNLLSIQNLKL